MVSLRTLRSFLLSVLFLATPQMYGMEAPADFSNTSKPDVAIDIVYPPFFQPELPPRFYFSLQECFQDLHLKEEHWDPAEEIHLLEELKLCCEEEAAEGRTYPLTPAIVENFIKIREQASQTIKNAHNFDCVIAHTKSSSLDQFSIAEELRTFAHQKNITLLRNHAIFKDFTSSEPLPQYAKDTVYATSHEVPMLHTLISNIAHYYHLPLPLIKLTGKFNCAAMHFDPTTGKDFLLIGIDRCAYLTDDEIQFLLAHEIAHFYKQHGFLEGVSLPLVGLTNTFKIDSIIRSRLGDALSRATEIEADFLALNYTKNPLAPITFFLKSRYLTTSLLKLKLSVALAHEQFTQEEKVLLPELASKYLTTSLKKIDVEHPTPQERIYYALALYAQKLHIAENLHHPLENIDRTLLGTHQHIAARNATHISKRQTRTFLEAVIKKNAQLYGQFSAPIDPALNQKIIQLLQNNDPKTFALLKGESSNDSYWGHCHKLPVNWLEACPAQKIFDSLYKPLIWQRDQGTPSYYGATQKISPLINNQLAIQLFKEMKKLYSEDELNDTYWATKIMIWHDCLPNYFIHQAFEHFLSPAHIDDYLHNDCSFESEKEKKLIPLANQHVEILKTNLTEDLAQHMLTQPNKYPASWIAVAQKMVDQDTEKKRARDDSNKSQDKEPDNNEKQTESSNKKPRLAEER